MFGKRSNGSTAPALAERLPAAPRPAAPPTAAPATSPTAAPADGAPQGGRTPFPSAGLGAPILGTPSATKANVGPQSPPQHVPSAIDTRRSDTYYETKGTIFGALIEAIDLGQLAKLDADSAREEIRDIVNEIIAIKNIVMSISEQEDLLDDICNDVLGYGPLEPLLARDEISDIMVNGSGTVYIEVGGKIQKTGIKFRDNQQLLNICQRIVSQVGRRVVNTDRAATHLGNRKAPMARLIQKLGLRQFRNVGPLNHDLLASDKVGIKLKQHIGAPATRWSRQAIA